MALSVKAIEKGFAHALDKVQDRAAAVKQIRDALVAFERGEINRDRVLHEANQALDAHGIETLRPTGARGIADYVNMGETYATTLLFSFRTARFYITSWGDWYERTPEYRAYSRAQEKGFYG